MATTACFIIVSRNDIPIYEAEVGSTAKREGAAQMHQFILHAALDIVQNLAWTTSAMTERRSCQESELKTIEENQKPEQASEQDKPSNPFLSLLNGFGILSTAVLGALYALAQKEKKKNSC